jgi:iron complex transport system permease protein
MIRPLSRRRYLGVLSACALACLAALLLSPLIGSAPLSLNDLRQALDFSRPLSDNPPARILLYGRLPRVLAAAIAGAGLSAAGVAFQGLLRNPLASPYTLGVSSGASLGAVLAIRFGLSTASLAGPGLFLSAGALAVPLCAFAGALLTVLLVYWIGDRGGAGPITLLLTGVTLSIVESALLTAVLSTADFGQTYRIVRWQMGDLDVMRYQAVGRMGAAVAVGLLLLLPFLRGLNALSAGPDTAAGLGVDIGRTTRYVYLSASLLVGAVVSVVGPIGFVGLVVPHALRGLCGPDHRLLLPASALCGATFLIGCDALAQVLLRPAILPVGVVTACIGGPFFLVLILSSGLRARLWS